LGKKRRKYPALIDLQKAYDTVNREKLRARDPPPARSAAQAAAQGREGMKQQNSTQSDMHAGPVTSNTDVQPRS
jgi:hypothetical protein